jgi:hypothetical protein
VALLERNDLHELCKSRPGIRLGSWARIEVCRRQYDDLKGVTFGFERAPIFSKHNWIVTLHGNGVALKIAIGGGPMSGEENIKELIVVLSKLKML